jgi:hypothetical protein
MTSSNHHQTKPNSPPGSKNKNEPTTYDPALENTPTLPGDVCDEITGHEPTLEMPHVIRSRSNNRS